MRTINCRRISTINFQKDIEIPEDLSLVLSMVTLLLKVISFPNRLPIKKRVTNVKMYNTVIGIILKFQIFKLKVAKIAEKRNEMVTMFEGKRISLDKPNDNISKSKRQNIK